MIALSGLTPEELSQRLSLKPPFRGRQLFQWIQKGVTDYKAMTNLPADLIERLEEWGPLPSSRLTDEQRSSDGTGKILLKLQDGLGVESVMLKDDKGRRTACLSTQAGCGMNCAFCKTATMGLKRNLEAGEIVEQFLTLTRRFGELNNIVFMGMGEPLANFDALRQSIRIFTHPEGRGMSPRRMTVSTCGLPDEINRLAQELPEVRLAVSLNAATDEIRNRLMPVNKRYPLPALRKALTAHQAATGKRITLEYVLLDGVNDRREDAEALMAFVREPASSPLKAVINLIPWNRSEGLDFREPRETSIRAFQRNLTDAGLKVVRRYRRGRDIDGACGQLAVSETEPS